MDEVTLDVDDILEADLTASEWGAGHSLKRLQLAVQHHFAFLDGPWTHESRHLDARIESSPSLAVAQRVSTAEAKGRWMGRR